MTVENLATLFVAMAAVAVSFWSLLLRSRHRSLELAQKYIDVLGKADSLENEKKFDAQLKNELKQTTHFLLWKSLSRLSSQRRSSFNYVGFLVIASAGLMLAAFSAVQSFSGKDIVLSILPVVSGLVIVLSMVFMAFLRYESYMLKSFIDLRNCRLYADSFSYSFLSKEKVLDESVVPVIASFAVSVPTLFFFGSECFFNLLKFAMLLISVGNIIEMTKNRMRTKEEADRSNIP